MKGPWRKGGNRIRKSVESVLAPLPALPRAWSSISLIGNDSQLTTMSPSAVRLEIRHQNAPSLCLEGGNDREQNLVGVVGGKGVVGGGTEASRSPETSGDVWPDHPVSFQPQPRRFAV